jgi:hypothetical protein
MMMTFVKFSGSFLLVLLWSTTVCQGYLAAPTATLCQLGFKLHKPSVGRYHHIGGLVAPSSFSSIRSLSRRTRVNAKSEDKDGNDNDKEKVVVGSSEYYQGFVSRSLTEEPEERVSGDAIITPILKGAAITTLVLGAFFLLFLKSNNLI